MDVARGIGERAPAQPAEPSPSGLHDLSRLLVGDPANDALALPRGHGPELERDQGPCTWRRRRLDPDNDTAKSERPRLPQVQRQVQRRPRARRAVRQVRHTTSAQVLRFAALVSAALRPGRVRESDGDVSGDTDPLPLFPARSSLGDRRGMPGIERLLQSPLSQDLEPDPPKERHEQHRRDDAHPDADDRPSIAIEGYEEGTPDVVELVRLGGWG
jgi:hypothetical protein